MGVRDIDRVSTADAVGSTVDVGVSEGLQDTLGVGDGV